MKGYTLIELMVVVAIVGILAALIAGSFTDGTVCRGGYKWVSTGYYSGYRQLMDEHGHAIPCNKE